MSAQLTQGLQAIQHDSTFIRVINEVNSAFTIRQNLIESLNKLTGRETISYVSQDLNHNSSMINDWDPQVIEDFLRGYKGNLEKVDLIIYSGGGFVESAERIVNSIYSYCDDFRVIIPLKAKSAATVVAMGASKILMSDTSEIGPIDPQIGDINKGLLPAQSVIKAYSDLRKEINEKQSRGEACNAELVSISKIDPVLVRECERLMGLSVDIAKKLLNKKMRANNLITEKEIKEKFLDDTKTFSHGRLIGWKEARGLGLEVEYVDKSDRVWELIWEIFIRTKISLERNMFPKIIENQYSSLTSGQLVVQKQ